MAYSMLKEYNKNNIKIIYKEKNNFFISILIFR